MTQSLLWQELPQGNEFSELCNALYEREIALLASAQTQRIESLQQRLKSLPYYVQKAAHAMVNVETPMTLDTQNATWSTRQGRSLPHSGQELEAIANWYLNQDLPLGLVVPVAVGERLVLDCVDRLDKVQGRVRTNAHGWFVLKPERQEKPEKQEQQGKQQGSQHPKTQLLKPTKKTMMASCAGHVWQNNKPCRPVILTLRELLLSCSINWKNLKKALPVDKH